MWRRGSTLLETVIALGIIGLVLVSLMTYLSAFQRQKAIHPLPDVQRLIYQSSDVGTTTDGWDYQVTRETIPHQDVRILRLEIEKDGERHTFATLEKEALDAEP